MELSVKLKERDAALRQFALRISDAHNHLHAIMEDYQDYEPLRKKLKGTNQEINDENAEQGLKVGSKSEKKGFQGVHNFPVDVSELIAYSQRISYTTFAPPLFAQGGPLIGALPPAPQDEQIRGCSLYFAKEDEVGMIRVAEDKTKLEKSSNVSETVPFQSAEGLTAGPAGMEGLLPAPPPPPPGLSFHPYPFYPCFLFSRNLLLTFFLSFRMEARGPHHSFRTFRCSSPPSWMETWRSCCFSSCYGRTSHCRSSCSCSTTKPECHPCPAH